MNDNVEGYRLSLQQERLWLLQRDSLAYRSQCAILIEGDLDKRSLQAALDAVIDQHEILRTTFHCRSGLALSFQVIGASGAPSSWQEIDLSEILAPEQEVRIEEIYREENGHRFDFARGPLVRLRLLTLTPERYVLLITLPALCADRRTLSNLVDDLCCFYAASPQDRARSVEPPLQYVDFSEWEHEFLESEDAERGKAYWRRQDYHALSAMSLPFEVKARTDSSFEPEVFSSGMNSEVFSKIQSAARRYQTSAANFLLACWQTLLWRLTGQSEIVVGHLSEGRKNDELKHALGLYAKSLPLGCHFDEGSPFSEILNQIAEAAHEAEEWQEYFSWEQTGDHFVDNHRTPFLPIAFEYAEKPADYDAAGLKFSILRQDACVDRFKIKLRCVEGKNSLATQFYYDPAIIPAEAVRHLAGQFTALAKIAADNSTVKISELEILTAEERQKLLVEFNQTDRDYALECLHELFEQQVRRSPKTIAAVYEREQLSYAELNERANQLGHYLQRQGVGPEMMVAILLPRSLEMIVAILGVLKAGAAYVPLEVAQPKDRLRSMLEDARVHAILTAEQLVASLPERETARVICLDTDREEIACESRSNTESRAQVGNAVYVIFTSGSTGRPKGVVIEHRQLVNYVKGVTERLEIPPGGSYATVSTFAADLGNTMLFPSLCSGGCLHVISQECLSDPVALGLYFSERPVDYLKIVPSHLESLLLSPQPEKVLPRKRLVLGGEPSRWEMVERVKRFMPGCEVYNHYGPTETTVGVITYHVGSGHADEQSEMVPLGRPLPNTEIFLLDAQYLPVARGVLGEVYIGGSGLARSYLNRPESTAEKFIPNPFSRQKGARLYKTGDLARYRPDGNLEFVGRADNQIKFHGYRVELNEIRTALNKHPQIRDSVIVATRAENGNATLVAYYVARRELAGAELREFLAAAILAETIPNIFIHLKKLPLTLNGKVNYEALPSPAEAQPRAERVFTAPQTEVEQSLALIWNQVLRVESVGIHDNFFELGGDSILCIQIIGRANQAGLRFTPRQLFEHQTIAELAAIIKKDPARQVAEQGTVTGPVPLTPIQHWFFERDLPEPHHWNLALMIEMRQKTDAGLLERALQALLAHHDALRLRFVRGEEGWRQMNIACEDAPILSRIDLSTFSEPEEAQNAMDKRVAQLQASLNLSDGPIMRACLFEFGPEKPARLQLIIHHLAVDGVSWRILLEDLQLALLQLGRGQAEAQLPSKTASFKQWSEKLTEYAAREELHQEVEYWLDELRPGVTSLPVDFPDGANIEATARTVMTVLSAEQTELLLREVPATYRTQINDVLLTALVEAFSEWTGARHLLVEMEGHGREEEISNNLDLSRTVGWFTARFPKRIELGLWFSNPGEALKMVKEQLRSVPRHGIGYGLLRYLSRDAEVLGKCYSAQRPQVSFNYLGQFDQVLAGSQMFNVIQEFGGSIRSPRASRSHLLEINSAVIDGVLQVAWTFSEQVHRRSTIEKLSNRFAENLLSLIAYCQRPEAGGFTPSDFPLAELNEKELGKLSLLLDQIDSTEGVTNER